MKHTVLNAEMNDDPLSRIQREINEVNKREFEFKNEHALIIQAIRLESKQTGEKLSGGGPDRLPAAADVEEAQEPAAAVSQNSSMLNGHATTSNVKTSLSRGMSAPQLGTAPLPLNAFTRRYNPNPGHKGLMQRFIASRGRLMGTALAAPSFERQHIVVQSHPTNASAPIAKDADGKPIRKGYTPVEEKIQKELREMKTREVELKKIRRQMSQPDLLAAVGYSDDDFAFSDDDDDVPLPGKLGNSKSIGELYDALGSGRTPSPNYSASPSPEPISRSKLRPAKSLAQLCDLSPEEAPSSTRLIAQWETLIQQKEKLTV